jgi:hypothetical protein
MFHSFCCCKRRRCILFPGFVAQSCCNPGCQAAAVSAAAAAAETTPSCKYCIFCQGQTAGVQQPCRLPAGCGCGGAFPPPPPPFPPFPPQPRPCGCRG